MKPHSFTDQQISSTVKFYCFIKECIMIKEGYEISVFKVHSLTCIQPTQQSMWLYCNSNCCIFYLDHHGIQSKLLQMELEHQCMQFGSFVKQIQMFNICATVQIKCVYSLLNSAKREFYYCLQLPNGRLQRRPTRLLSEVQSTSGRHRKH